MWHPARMRVLAGLIALVTACASDHHGGAGSEAIPPSSTALYHVQPNTATGVVAGTQAGYGVRTLGGNDTFRILWTGDGAAGGGYHEFWGTVWTSGHFSGLLPGCTNAACPLEASDFVSGVVNTSGGERVDWDTFANDGLDGFEVTTDTLPLYFDLFVDGARLPNLVFFPAASQGGQIATVGTIPFALTAP
jgi:hypothetical protein